MKYTFKLIAVFLLLFSFGCSSSKDKTKIETYTELETTIVESLMDEYSIVVPETWYSYLESHKHLCHSPKEFLLHKNIPQTSLYIFKKRTKKNNNINDLTKSFIKKMRKKYQDFNYDLVKGKHPIYGRYNFIIYKSSYFNKNHTTLNAIILKDNYYYTITYHALSKDYKKYADDVVKIIHSFRVKE